MKNKKSSPFCRNGCCRWTETKRSRKSRTRSLHEANNKKCHFRQTIIHWLLIAEDNVRLIMFAQLTESKRKSQRRSRRRETKEPDYPKLYCLFHLIPLSKPLNTDTETSVCVPTPFPFPSIIFILGWLRRNWNGFLVRKGQRIKLLPVVHDYYLLYHFY